MEEILNRLGVRELQSLARALDLPGRSKMTKPQLVEAVSAGLKSGQTSPTNGFREPRRAGLLGGEERRRAANDRLGLLVDHDRICSFATIEGFACGLPVVRDQDRCSLHGGTDNSDLAIPATGALGFETWPALVRHLQIASYDIDALGLDPVVAEILWHCLLYTSDAADDN